MKVLVVGSGGREHALAWKIAASPMVEEVLCAPGNAGTTSVGRNCPVKANDLTGLVRLAVKEEVGLVVVGPEDPLVGGLSDRLRERGIEVFGPGKEASQLEGSKWFTKELLERHRIPTGGWRKFDRAGAAKAYLEGKKEWPQVVKADGLAAGKGVFVCADAREACRVVDTLMEEGRLGDAGRTVVIEEFLSGEEVSVHAITDGSTLLILDAVVDHKQVGEGDTGPNTGGMGVFSPASWLTRRLMRQIEQRILLPTLHALRIEDIEYRGVLFVGLMVSDTGPRVLEFNCRFGDPETQAMMRRFDGDIVPYLLATARGNLSEMEPPRWDERAVVGVVAASAGYPDDYEKGYPITGLGRAAEDPDTVVFHAGTRQDGPHTLTDGGRVLCVTSMGADAESARERAYAGYDHIQWEGKFCRRDIGLPRRSKSQVLAGAEDADA